MDKSPSNWLELVKKMIKKLGKMTYVTSALYFPIKKPFPLIGQINLKPLILDLKP